MLTGIPSWVSLAVIVLHTPVQKGGWDHRSHLEHSKLTLFASLVPAFLAVHRFRMLGTRP